METRVLTAHVPVHLAKRVDQAAIRLERSRGWIVQKAVAVWLRQEEERRLLTREALADVDAGRVLDQKDMEEWASKLGSQKTKRR